MKFWCSDILQTFTRKVLFFFSSPSKTLVIVNYFLRALSAKGLSKIWSLNGSSSDLAWRASRVYISNLLRRAVCWRRDENFGGLMIKRLLIWHIKSQFFGHHFVPNILKSNDLLNNRTFLRRGPHIHYTNMNMKSICKLW